MKKLLAMCLLVAACGVSVSAQPYEYYRPYTDFDVMDGGHGLRKNTTRVEIFGGVADPEGDRKMGDVGFSAGLGFVRNFSAPFALGADVNFTRLSAGDKYWLPSMTNNPVNTRTGIVTGLVTGRINLFPRSATRIYIPGGVGVGHIYSTQKDQVNDDNETFNSTSFAWMVGLGVEFDVADDLIFGVEARYNGITLNDKYRDRFDRSVFEYYTAMVKFGFKF